MRSAAARRRISSRTIARKLGLSAAAMSRRMTGDVEFRASELDEIATLLDVPLGQLLEPDASEVSA